MIATLLLATAAGLLGGAMNALAGGGTFATMPTLIALGLPSTIANATSNVALQPGAMASAWAYRDRLTPLPGLSIRALVGTTFAGGVVGGLLLVATPTRVFDLVIPWLLLFATVTLAFGRSAADWLAARVKIGTRTLVSVQFLLGIYGGYFGGGVGLIMVALWGLLAGLAPHGLVAHRTLALAMANAAAMLIFVVSGMVHWALAVPMAIGATAGGYCGARLARLLSPGAIRFWTLLLTAATTAVFFHRTYS